MFEALAAAIEEVEIPLDGDALAEAFALADRLQSKLVAAVADFDRAELWDLDGSTSMTAWLKDPAGLTNRRARHLAGVARRLGDLPVTAAAWRCGELRGGQVDAIVAAVDDATVELFARPRTRGGARPGRAVHGGHDPGHGGLEGACHADGTEPVEPDRALHLSSSFDGTGILDATLTAEGYALVKTALRLAERADGDGDPPRTPAQRRHDALVDVIRNFLDHQQPHRGGRHRPHVNIVITVEDLDAGRGGHVVDGPTLDPITIDRLLCDSAIHRVVMAGRSTILDYGTATKTTPVNLWNALVVRDHGCRWPGCDRPPEWCEAHHITWASNHGPTRPDNEALLCSRHHHIAHRPGWCLHLDTEATLTVTDPTGRTRVTRPPAPSGPSWRDDARCASGTSIASEPISTQ
jgi:hypothetical protein